MVVWSGGITIVSMLQKHQSQQTGFVEIARFKVLYASSNKYIVFDLFSFVSLLWSTAWCVYDIEMNYSVCLSTHNLV